MAWEARASEPILPLHLFRNPIFTVASAITFLLGLALFGAVVYLPEYLQVVQGASAISSGLQLIPLTLGSSSPRPAAASWSAVSAATRSSRSSARRC